MREVETAGVKCTVEEAKQFIESFFQTYPLVKQLIDRTQKQVEDLGYVETLWGRKEYFYKVEGDDGSIIARQKRQAVNFLYEHRGSKTGLIRGKPTRAALAAVIPSEAMLATA